MNYPPDIEQFVERQVASGMFPSREAFEIEAVRHFMKYADARDRVKADIDSARSEAEAGLESDWDLEEFKREMSEKFDEHGQRRQ